VLHAGQYDLTGRNLPKIRQPREPEPSIINEKKIVDFMRMVEQNGNSGARRGSYERDRQLRRPLLARNKQCQGRDNQNNKSR
jgi:hypothetical protein